MVPESSGLLDMFIRIDDDDNGILILFNLKLLCSFFLDMTGNQSPNSQQFLVEVNILVG